MVATAQFIDSSTLPGFGAEAIVPDTALAKTSREIYVGVGGDIVADFADGSQVTLVGVPSGSRLPYRVTNIVASGTTATNLVGIH